MTTVTVGEDVRSASDEQLERLLPQALNWAHSGNSIHPEVPAAGKSLLDELIAELRSRKKFTLLAGLCAGM